MEQNLLIEDLQPEIIHASAGKRLLNFIIDTIGMYILIFIVAMFFAGVSPDSFEEDPYSNDSSLLVWNLGGLFIFLLYYFLFEFATGGRTPGKLITGTKAVMEDGSKIDFATSLKRNAIRLVPFELFSYFGSPCEPWHDRWSGTRVMDIKKTTLNAF